jgi:hypothetical protein
MSVRWVIDKQAVTQACHTLGLQHPVKVTFTRAKPWWWGTYNPLHRIRINHTIKTKRDLSHVIWHELAHAMQCERDCHSDKKRFYWMVNSQSKGFQDKNGKCLWDTTQESWDEWCIRYYQIPMEAEAETIAELYAKTYPLVKRSTS